MANLKEQLKEVKKLLGDGRDHQLSDNDALRYQDILCLLEERGYLLDLQVDGVNWYRKLADFDGFEDWLNEEIKESKRVTRRENHLRNYWRSDWPDTIHSYFVYGNLKRKKWGNNGTTNNRRS